MALDFGLSEVSESEVSDSVKQAYDKTPGLFRGCNIAPPTVGSSSSFDAVAGPPVKTSLAVETAEPLKEVLSSDAMPFFKGTSTGEFAGITTLFMPKGKATLAFSFFHGLLLEDGSLSA